MNGLIGFGSDPSLGMGQLPGMPADLTPVTHADLQAALDEQARKQRYALISVGLGAAVFAVGVAWLMARR